MGDWMLMAAVARPTWLGQTWSAILADFGELGSPSAMAAFGQVLLIDIMLAGDNAIVVGTLAAGLPAGHRRRVILIGITAALLLRILFALAVTQLLHVPGLVLIGGMLLLIVAWKMWRELRAATACETAPPRAPRGFAAAILAVIVADVSMSLDNVLGVAAAARTHPGILVLGLLLSVALMGAAANMLAHYITRHGWIAYVGLAVIIYVAGRMVHEGIADPDTGVWRMLRAG